MRSAVRGESTSAVEVTNISKHGLWLIVRDHEYFLPFRDFPWFESATIGEVLNVELSGPDHLYWPALDVDLSLESVEHPERFPLVSRGRPARAAAAARPSRDRTET
jgi:hypothetical protein